MYLVHSLLLQSIMCVHLAQQPSCISAQHMLEVSRPICEAVVCRAARLCQSAAHGGQILAPLELVQQLVKTWAGTDLELQAHHKPAKAAKPHAEQGDFAIIYDSPSMPPPPLPPPPCMSPSQKPAKAANVTQSKVNPVNLLEAHIYTAKQI